MTQLSTYGQRTRHLNASVAEITRKAQERDATSVSCPNCKRRIPAGPGKCPCCGQTTEN